MGAKEVLAELLGESFDDLGQRNAAGAGGENGVGFRDRFHAAPDVALDLKIFGNGFDDPIAFGDLVEVVIVVADFDELYQIVGEEAGRLLLDGGLNRFHACGIAVLFSDSPGSRAAKARRNWQSERQRAPPWCRRPEWPRGEAFLSYRDDRRALEPPRPD